VGLGRVQVHVLKTALKQIINRTKGYNCRHVLSDIQLKFRLMYFHTLPEIASCITFVSENRQKGISPDPGYRPKEFV